MTRFITHFAIPLFCFFLFTLQTMSQPLQMLTDCDQLPENFTQTISYRSNRDTVLSTLRDRSSFGSYSNATTGLSPNTVYGMFLCRGDINKTFCSGCVHTATLEIAKTCDSYIGAFIFYEECMVRYSNFSFFTLLEVGPSIARHSHDSLNSSQFFNQTLPGKIDDLIVRASARSPFPYFVDNQERVTQLEGSYDLEAMVQCSPDLSPGNCTDCLRLAVQEFFECWHCNHSQARWAKIFYPKCLVNYNISALQPSFSVTNGNKIYGRTFIAIMTASVLALMGL